MISKPEEIMRRIIIWIAVLALLIPGVLHGAQKALIAPAEILLRQGPGSYFPVVDVIAKGTCCTIIQEAGAWYYISVGEDGKKKGYASKKSFETQKGKTLASYRFETDIGFGGRVSSTEVTAATKGLGASPTIKKYSSRKQLDFTLLEYVERIPFKPEEYREFAGTLKSPSRELLGAVENAYVRSSDIDLGRAIVLKFASEQGLVKDDELIKYISMVGTWVQNGTPLYDVPFYYGVIDQDYVNSFALPGGYILVTRGCLAAMENEAELAAVLAHEMAHLIKRHGMQELERQKERVKSARAMDDLDEMAMKKGVMPEDEAAFEAMDNLTNEMFSILIKGRLQADEFEADRYGTLYLANSGYYQYALVKFLKRLGKNEKLKYVSHPEPEKRIDNIKSEISRARLKKYQGASQQNRYEVYALGRLK
jgi:uncharacterized protein YraI